MINTDAANFHKSLFKYLDAVINFDDVINVSTEKGNVVILNEEDYNGLMETLYLTSVAGMKKRLQEGLDAKSKDCVEFEW